MNSLTNLAREVFSHDTYATHISGVTIEDVTITSAVCSLAIDSRHRNAKGSVMGGAIFTLADLAAAIAANSHILAASESADSVQLQWVSSTADIHFLNAAKGEKLSATASPVKKGRKMTVVSTSISDNQGTLVAIVTTTFNTVSSPISNH